MSRGWASTSSLELLLSFTLLLATLLREYSPKNELVNRCLKEYLDLVVRGSFRPARSARKNASRNHEFAGDR